MESWNGCSGRMWCGISECLYGQVIRLGYGKGCRAFVAMEFMNAFPPRCFVAAFLVLEG